MTEPSHPEVVNLEAERLDRGLSALQAAEEMGIAPGTLQRAERGLGIHPASKKAIADFYGFRVRDIWPVERAA